MAEVIVVKERSGCGCGTVILAILAVVVIVVLVELVMWAVALAAV